MLSLTPDGLSGAPPLRARPALQLSYLSTRDRGAGQTPGASAGFHIFNGDGTGHDIVTVRIGGKIVLDKIVAPFSYIVNADCTGSYTVQIPNGPSFDLFIAPSGEAVATISTAPEGNNVSTIDERVH